MTATTTLFKIQTIKLCALVLDLSFSSRSSVKPNCIMYILYLFLYRLSPIDFLLFFSFDSFLLFSAVGGGDVRPYGAHGTSYAVVPCQINDVIRLYLLLISFLTLLTWNFILFSFVSH